MNATIEEIKGVVAFAKLSRYNSWLHSRSLYCTSNCVTGYFAWKSRYSSHQYVPVRYESQDGLTDFIDDLFFLRTEASASCPSSPVAPRAPMYWRVAPFSAVALPWHCGICLELAKGKKKFKNLPTRKATAWLFQPVL